jgi:hypothetical protein
LARSTSYEAPHYAVSSNLPSLHLSWVFSQKLGTNITVPLGAEPKRSFFRLSTEVIQIALGVSLTVTKFLPFPILLLGNSFILLLNSKVVFYNYFKTNIIFLVLFPLCRFTTVAAGREEEDIQN